jgi:hypothetical protein
MSPSDPSHIPNHQATERSLLCQTASASLLRRSYPLDHKSHFNIHFFFPNQCAAPTTHQMLTVVLNGADKIVKLSISHFIISILSGPATKYR